MRAARPRRDGPILFRERPNPMPDKAPSGPEVASPGFDRPAVRMPV